MVTEERFWATYARWYDTIWDGPVTDRVREKAHELLGSPEKVIDLGCGTGLLSAGLIDRGIEVIGVDTACGMLSRALATRRVSRAVHAPAEATGLGSGIADAVIIANLLHLHPNPTAVLAEARRIAAPGARIVITSPVPRLSPRAMLRADRRAGRPVAASWKAHILRRWIGRLGMNVPGPVADRAHGTDTHRLVDLLDSNARVVAGCAVVGLPSTEL